MRIPDAPVPPYPAWVEIDLDAIAHNHRQVRERVGAQTLIYVVIKSNAYGHGLIPVARRLLEEGADGLCVARIWEAQALRRAGVTAPVLTLASIVPDEAPLAAELDLDTMIFRPEPARALSQAAVAAGRRARVHMKVDSGMGRLGVTPEDAVEFARFLTGLPGIELGGLMTHFSNADDDEDAVTREQLATYQGAIEALRAAGLLPPVCHSSNSDATMRFEAARFQLVRPGMSTYGCYPSEWYRRHFDLKPAMSVRARLISVKHFPAGRGLSYSHQYTTPRDSVIGVVQVGYADGYLRALMNKTCMIVRGRRAPVLGRICMEQSLLDLTDIPGATYGDIVTVMGAADGERVTADDLARWAGTINYEIVNSLGRQFPHIYHSRGRVWRE